MRYELIIEDKAIRVLKKLQPKLQARIRQKLLHIASNPYDQHNEVTKLQGRDDYRLRVGDWRIFYVLEDKQLKLLALDIKSRGQAYKH